MKREHVVLKVDTSGIERALRKVKEQMRELGIVFQRAGRNGWRSRLTPGERHIDRMCREVAGKPDAALRLFVAAGCVAPVLDGEDA